MAQQQVPLIRRVSKDNRVRYEVCRQGLAILRQLRPKKLRILLNVTHAPTSLIAFNRWLLNLAADENVTRDESVCLSICKQWRQLEGDRVILVCNAYENSQFEPLMVLLGYLASSVLLYHHFSAPLQIKSQLTQMLARLNRLLESTDINDLNREIKFKKGYSRTPYFLCLLDEKAEIGTIDFFKQFYRYTEGSEDLNMAVDTLLNYFPERASTNVELSMKSVSKIGFEFQESILGRELFNFQFTGATLQNLCFQCCEKFNQAAPLNLLSIYSKIIANQKARLEDEVYQQYIEKVQINYFGGRKVDYRGGNAFPLTSSQLYRQHSSIREKMEDQAVKMAANCMDLNEYVVLHHSLSKRITQQLGQLESINNEKAEQLCSQCYQLLQNLGQSDGSVEGIANLFKQASNKLQLYNSQCQQLLSGDATMHSFNKYMQRLQEKFIQQLELVTVEMMEDLQLKEQQHRAEVASLKYNLRVNESELRKLQFQYGLQGDILNEYKVKLAYEPEVQVGQVFNSETNRLHKRVQQLEEEVKDKALEFEELEGVLERFQGLKEKEKLKYKFSRQITQMIREVSTKINSCYNCIKQVRQTNSLFQDLKAGLEQERQDIIESKKKMALERAHKESQIQKLIYQKNLLQQSIDQARQAIQVYKQVADQNKEAIGNLQNTYTQLNCCLAEAESDLQSFKKALCLLAEQQKGRSQNLLKFYKVLPQSELRQLLTPFLKR